MAITYCIVCNITGEKYYGSSKNTLIVRMSFHKCKSNTCCSKQIIERGDYDIYQLAEYETIEEAENKEDWYIRNKKCINKRRVRITDEEKKQYYEKNREKMNENSKEYYYNNSEKMKKYNKEWRLKNRQEYNAKTKIFYENNKDKINGKKRERVNCNFCGKEYSRDSLIKHKKLFHFNAILA